MTTHTEDIREVGRLVGCVGKVANTGGKLHFQNKTGRNETTPTLTRQKLNTGSVLLDATLSLFPGNMPDIYSSPTTGKGSSCHKHTEVSVVVVLQGETSGHDTGSNILCKMHCQMHFRLD